MAYTKTNWANDNPPPLDATNLMKIENKLEELDARPTSSDWNLISATLTYASATAPSFVANTSIDLTSLISVGMKLKLTQTTVKYFIVTAITSTNITLYGGDNYVLASATITDIYYSAMQVPIGFPNTFNLGQFKFPVTQNPSSDPNTLDDYEEGSWTPVNAQNSGQIGTWSTYVGRYTKIGKVVVATIEITGTGMGYNTTTGFTKFTGLPFTPQGGAGGTWVSGNIAGGLCGMSLAINTDNAFWLASPQVANVTSTVIWGSAMYLVA